MALINITTLGCPKNQVDSSHLIKRFSLEGSLHVDSPDKANIILVNTCGFIKEAKEESIEEILRLAEMKKNGTKLIVFGCLAQRYKDEIEKEIPEIDAIFGVSEEDMIIEYCKGVEVQKLGNAEDKDILKKTSKLQGIQSSYGYLKIAEGCDKKCTFCIIPSIRGRFRSIQPKQILKEAEELISQNVRELIVVAQDITNYGKNLNEYNLVSLLNDLASIDGDFRIRLLYLYPTEITEEMIDLIANEDKIQKYIDMPLQHSSDKILRLMGRRGTKKDYIKLIRNLRRDIPGVALRTTFIVGFPQETEEDFSELVDFIEEIRFDRLGVFKYSKEEGTPASRLKGHLPEKVKQRRFDEIMKRQALISLQKNMEMIGKKYDAIIDDVDDNIAIARLYCHAPEIDGVVIIDSAEVRKCGSAKVKEPLSYQGLQIAKLKVGDIVTVKITDAFDYDLKGIIVN